MNLLLPGMHAPGRSAIHQLDPRVKMAVASWLMIIPFIALSAVSGILLILAVVGIALLSRAPIPALARTLRAVLWLGLFMFFFYLFTTPGDPIVAVLGVSVTAEGLIRAVAQIYRLALLVLVSSLLTFTTSPSQLTQAVEAVLSPLAGTGGPVRELSMVMMIGLRFVPTLFAEVDKIAKAQRARGADLRARNPWRRVKSWAPTFVPIFVAAFRRADALAVAMEARGYRGAATRTHLRELQLTRRDLWAFLAILALSLVLAGCECLF